MKRISTLFMAASLLLAASTCFAQMYTVTDLGSLGGFFGSYPRAGINASGQMGGYSSIPANPGEEDSIYPSFFYYRAFRTRPKTPMARSMDDLGTLGGHYSYTCGLNSLGQAVGNAHLEGDTIVHAFRTAPNKPINSVTDDLGTLGGTSSGACGINTYGQVVGLAYVVGDATYHAFRTAPNNPIVPATDDLGTLGGTYSDAWRINSSGQVVGSSAIPGDLAVHAYRTAPNSAIDPVKDDLGTLGGTTSVAYDVNVFGQVVGTSTVGGDSTYHAFRTAPNQPINPATDDLGPGYALSINDYGQAVGGSYLYTSGLAHDLNTLIQTNTFIQAEYRFIGATGINNAGEISAEATVIDNNGTRCCRTVLLTPIYKAFVQQPINADGSSVFSVKRGVVPVKFSLTQYGAPTCTLSPATIAITKAGGGTLASLDESVYSTNADSRSNFRIDAGACQYVYNLAASALGVGTYRVDISLNGIMVGHAVFALK